MADMHATDSPVLFENDDGIAVLSLNRPSALNAVNDAMRWVLIARLKEVNADDRVRAVILKGADARAFSSGQDLEDACAVGLDGLVAWQEKQRKLLQAVRDLDKPCVTAADGVCVGLGFHIALCSDWRIATARSTWGQPEVKVGLASITGPYLMSLYVGHARTAELSVGANLFDGRRAYEVGFVTELTSPEELVSGALSRARQMAALPATAIRLTKQRQRAVTQPGFDEAFSYGVRAQLECFASGEPQEMMAAFLARRNRKAG